MTPDQEDRLKDLVSIKDMMPNLGNLRSDVAAALQEIERLRCIEAKKTKQSNVHKA